MQSPRAMNPGRRGQVALLLLVAGVLAFDLARDSFGPAAAATRVVDGEERAASSRAATRAEAAPVARPATGDDVTAASRGLVEEREEPAETGAAPERPAPLADRRPIEPFAGPPAVLAGRVVARDELPRRVRELLRHEQLANVSVGLALYSVTHGESLLRIDASTPRIPASNAKLVTTAAVLAVLGRDFAFETRLVAGGTVDGDGVLRGDLVVVGDGDPDARELDGTALVDRLAEAARAAGLRRVEGRLLVDDRCFDREPVAEGWNDRDRHKAFSAPVSGFSSCGNTLAIEVVPAATVGAPATVRASLPGPPFELDASVETGPAGSKHLIDVRPMPAVPGRIVVRGKTPHGSKPVPVEVAVLDPARVAGERLKAALARAGVPVTGDVVLMPLDAPRADATVAPLATATTPLAPLLRVLNKESSNVVAEHLFKRCGFAHEGIGSFASAGRAVRAGVERLGLEWGGSRAADGSGLSRDDRYSADLLVSLLDRLYRSSSRDVVLDSLAVAGVDGTLRRRLAEPRYRGRVRGKTGYVAGVSSVSGFAQTDAGEVIAFSILMNRLSGWAGHARQVQDDVLRLLCDLAPR